jgi:hypothetical protein
MRIAGIAVALTALAATAVLADIVRHASVPERLLGSWAESADGCGPDDKTVIVLSAKAYEGADGKCAVDWVSETAGPRGPIYSARLRCSDPPPGKSPIFDLIIRPDDAKTISVGLNFDSLKVYRKCAAKE